MNLFESEIGYHKEDDISSVTTVRTVIFTQPDTDTRTCFDVTSLSVDERTKLKETYEEYQAYVNQQSKMILNFETWADASGIPLDPDTIHWRKLKRSNIRY